ncbi:hypothetical protein FOQG_06220 [Fusarium oxysporum f. sp. raphani 54005]|uniref:Uncharacterized protein n=1 Tax=Fusarium oxysporum f. sp. raphani 54005 TaxID=1089458 RepID=X0CKT8_FUSOX|nr:hypothetical protein FOQG_06220 [Fusarium oxysporum f. sp. raphani 54005]
MTQNVGKGEQKKKKKWPHVGFSGGELNAREIITKIRYSPFEAQDPRHPKLKSSKNKHVFRNRTTRTWIKGVLSPFRAIPLHKHVHTIKTCIFLQRPCECPHSRKTHPLSSSRPLTSSCRPPRHDVTLSSRPKNRAVY